jgi:hypothetical protein
MQLCRGAPVLIARRDGAATCCGESPDAETSCRRHLCHSRSSGESVVVKSAGTSHEDCRECTATASHAVQYGSCEAPTRRRRQAHRRMKSPKDVENRRRTPNYDNQNECSAGVRNTCAQARGAMLRLGVPRRLGGSTFSSNSSTRANCPHRLSRRAVIPPCAKSARKCTG